MSSPIVDADTTARIAALIAPPHGAQWAAIATSVAGAPLADVVAQLWMLDDGTDPEMHATAQAASIVLRELQPPVMRGFSEVAQLIGEVSVVAGAVRWTAAAIGEQIQRGRDQRRQVRDGAAERTDLLELY